MQQAPLPLTVDPDDISVWPEVCLAEIWQPQTINKTGLGPYTRKLFAAPDWETLWRAVDKTAVWQPALRPVAITKYSCPARGFTLLVKAVNLNLRHPRLFAVDGLYSGPHQSQAAPLLPSIPLVQLQALADRLPALWYELQATVTANLRAIGVIAAVKGKIIEQPLSTKDSWVDRTCWRHVGESRYTVLPIPNPYSLTVQTAFMEQAIVTEANLASLALQAPLPPTATLNPGLIARLRKRGWHDPMAPTNLIDAKCSTNRSRVSRLTIFPALTH